MTTLQEVFDKYTPANEFDLGFYTLIVTAIIARFIYYLSKVFSPIISRHYVSSTPATQADWDSRTVSTINAIVVTYLAYHVLFFDGESSVNYHEHPITYRTRLGLFTQCIIGGYLINDTAIVWSHRKGISAVNSTIFHHILALSGIVFCWLDKITLFYPIAFALTEASTPFVNIRWWLYSADKKKTNVYLVAGLLMTLSFFVIRILFVPYIVFHSYYRVGFDTLMSLPWGPFIMAVFYPAAGNALNVFWFVLILKGLIRALFSRSTGEKKESKKAK